MKQEYPKMLYKTREDYKIAHNIIEHEALVKKGYGEFKIMILGQKPEPIPDSTPDSIPDSIPDFAKKPGIVEETIRKPVEIEEAPRKKRKYVRRKKAEKAEQKDG